MFQPSRGHLQVNTLKANYYYKFWLKYCTIEISQVYTYFV